MNKWRGKFTDHTKLGLLSKATFPLVAKLQKPWSISQAVRNPFLRSPSCRPITHSPKSVFMVIYHPCWSPRGPAIWWLDSPECPSPHPGSLPGPALISPLIHPGTAKTRVKQLTKMYCRFRVAITTVQYRFQPHPAYITFGTCISTIHSHGMSPYAFDFLNSSIKNFLYFMCLTFSTLISIYFIIYWHCE